MAIKIANAPCTWGTLEFEGMSGERITCRQMLDELRETGYEGTELGDWGFMPTEPAALRQELDSRGLTMVGAFVPVALKDADAHAAGEAEAVKVALLLAGTDTTPAPYIILADANGTDPVRTRNAGRVTPEMGLSEDEWKVFARGAERVAAAVRRETGLPTLFHHHCAGYVETPEEIARLMELTDPDILGLVFDTGHYLYGTGAGGRNAALEGLERFWDRVRHLHFKDCSPQVAAKARSEGWDYFQAVGQGVFCELGCGEVDFPGIVRFLNGCGYSGWITVEQDVLPGMGAPRESAVRNREYLRSLGL
ncbi:MAG TPA: TIM barrel protein [Acidobacteriota bacterium]|nr:TIM barrel protein [Acidobacteriota bacterium]